MKPKWVVSATCQMVTVDKVPQADSGRNRRWLPKHCWMRHLLHCGCLLAMLSISGCASLPDDEREQLVRAVESKKQQLETLKEDIKNLPKLTRDCENLERQVAKLKKARPPKR